MYWIKNKSTHFLYKFIRCLSRAFFRLFYKHKEFGLENLCPGGAIIAANHVSFYDPPLISVSTPEEIHFLARKSLFDHLFFGWLIRRLNAHPVSGDASDVSVLRTILKLLKEGKKVLLFPEGTRKTGEIEEVKEGLGLLAQKSGCPIIPAYIFGVDQIWSRERRFPKLTGKTRVVFGQAIDPKDFAHLDRREAHSAIAKAFVDALKQLRRKGNLG